MLLHDKLKPYRLILASQSPRRRQLLAACGLKFETAECYGVDEVYPPSLPATEVPVYLARLKSEAYPHPLESNEILITADTVVILDDRIIGKPKPGDREDALATLRKLSGRTHTVITGVALRSAGRLASFDAVSHVRFKTLSEEEIAYYVDHYRPYDKAGAYGIQEWIGYIAIEHVDGSFYNIMGLPVQHLYTELDQFTSL